jgi:hypothetical protein
MNIVTGRSIASRGMLIRVTPCLFAVDYLV